MATSMASGNTAPLFVVATASKPSVEGQRKLIRSHVMRGKNRKKLRNKPPSWINGGNLETEDSWNAEEKLGIPPRVGGELSFSPYAATLTADMMEVILGFAGKAKQAMLPPEQGLVVNHLDSSWLEPMWNDLACLHFTVFIGHVYFNRLRGREDRDEMTMVHFAKTLAILRQRLALSNVETSITDSTILVVIGLVMAASALGEFQAARQHLSGLHSMVMLRGGMAAFRANKQLQVKIADLGIALATGSQPLFFDDDIAWGSYLNTGQTALCAPSDQPTLLGRKHLEVFIDSLDTRLCIVWKDLAQYVEAVNIAEECGSRIDSELYQEVMVSVHYRLVKLCFDEDYRNETIRLSLLAFASTLFLQWPGARINYQYLGRHLYEAVTQLKSDATVFPVNIAVWLHFVGAISVFDAHKEARLHVDVGNILRDTNMTSWATVRPLLRSVMWVGAVHDSEAEIIVRLALSEGKLSAPNRNTALEARLTIANGE